MPVIENFEDAAFDSEGQVDLFADKIIRRIIRTIMTEERLQKVIAQAGIASRREAEKMILAGRVRVDGQVVTKLGTKVHSIEQVVVDGQPIERESHHTFLFTSQEA